MSKANYLCSVENEDVTDTNRSLHISGLPLRLLEQDLGDRRPKRVSYFAALPEIGLKCYYSVDACYLRQLLSMAPWDDDACLRLVMETTIMLPILYPISIGGPNDGPKC
jgi:hypothetical protein